MWLYLGGACDIRWHYELSESLNFTWWVVVGVFIQLSLWSVNESANSDWKQRELCKIHSSYLEILTHWLEEDNTAANPVGKRFGPPCWVLCSVSGPLTWAYREVVFNKCSQHCFLHPVWLHFSPKSNESFVILLGLLTENVSHALET